MVAAAWVRLRSCEVVYQLSATAGTLVSLLEFFFHDVYHRLVEVALSTLRVASHSLSGGLLGTAHRTSISVELKHNVFVLGLRSVALIEFLKVLFVGQGV